MQPESAAEELLRFLTQAKAGTFDFVPFEHVHSGLGIGFEETTKAVQLAAERGWVKAFGCPGAYIGLSLRPGGLERMKG